MLTLKYLYRRVISRQQNLTVASGVAATKYISNSLFRMSSHPAGPVVLTPDGTVRGRVQTSIRGEQYYSFQGIPYAQPPVGDLRFQAPRQVKPWDGELLAQKEGNSSVSFAMGTTDVLSGSSEDCLYLNVYSKKIPDGKTDASKLPVMVFIHGGGFFFGSGDTDFYGPDYLVSKDIVLITINYRLGALGFLSLQNDKCPGNNGLKDQVEALRWVQRNVSSFGGDPGNVTIFGESAGGASVQYLMLSPLTKGLFHRAISQSGSVLNPWAHSRYPVKSAFKLTELLGCTTDNKDVAFSYLKSKPAEDIVKMQLKVLRKVEPESFYFTCAFGPVVEPNLPGAFLTESLETLVKEGRVHDVPYIIGVNTLEGLIMALGGLPPLVTKEEWERLLPMHVNLKKGSILSDVVLEKIKSFYFSQGYDEKKCCEVLSAVYFLAGVDATVQGLSQSKNRKSPTYFYEFTLEGFTLWKDFMGFSDWKGTFHGDELTCLFYSNFLKQQAVAGSVEERGIDMLCSFWTDFAANGNPTPRTNAWPKYTKEDKSYLNIGEKPVSLKDWCAEQMQFWRTIFALINEPPANKL